MRDSDRNPVKIEHKSGNDQIGYQDQVASIFGSVCIANYYQDNIKISKASKNWEEGIIDMIEQKGFLFLGGGIQEGS